MLMNQPQAMESTNFLGRDGIRAGMNLGAIAIGADHPLVCKETRSMVMFFAKKDCIPLSAIKVLLLSWRAFSLPAVHVREPRSETNPGGAGGHGAGAARAEGVHGGRSRGGKAHRWPNEAGADAVGRGGNVQPASRRSGAQATAGHGAPTW